MTTTPSSENTLYFDAPITHFHMSSQDVQPPATAANGVTHSDSSVVIPTNESTSWLPATDLPSESDSPNHGRKSNILKSSAPRRSESLRHGGSLSRHSLFTNSDGRPVEGSTFINGAGTTGPNAQVEQNDDMNFRAASAEAALTPKQRSKIAKSEAKEGKRLSKIIKKEAKVEKEALNVAINELAELQKLQKTSVKNEAKAHTTHAKVLAEFQKLEAAYLSARGKYEIAQARLNAEAERLEIIRSNARENTDRLQEKSQEVDGLRIMYAVDERERAAKLGGITSTNTKATLKTSGSRWK